MQHFATANYESLLPDAGPFETWKENGSLSAEQRANVVYKSMLEQYVQPTLDSSIDEALTRFIEEKKSSMPDEWH